MTRDEFFRIVTAKEFFTKYCTEVTNYKHKMRGIDGNKKPIDFTDEDKRYIRKAAAKLGIDISKTKF